ncbi:phospholipase [Mangrovactinospora gilvigrisea]|uniref:Phospholipase n=1 Tax=Mangrovactinospora gilvigrisea TaxID=1428644 RepID=A0A1J7C1V9_9ACTN|nr:alkaline phosphatase family protein [Mangrovactinospora gilvigrisea]OIV35572.1 phospholipase [Mangrovactinospora gilvigrisea]
MAGQAGTGTASGRGRRLRRTAARWAALTGAVALAAAAGGTTPALASSHQGHGGSDRTTTPVKHVVVLFDENISFDHYFATYPKAANTDGTAFTAAKHTPRTNNLVSNNLLAKNPNQYLPKRLSSSQAMTCDQNHSYTPEQYAANGGKADQYVQNTDSGKCSGDLFGEPGLVMDYYDGNTVTGLWNYAQHYTLNDNSFSSSFGPSTPGALNLVSGQTHGAVSMTSTSTTDPTQTSTPDSFIKTPNAKGVGTLSGDVDPVYDDCSNSDHSSKSDLLGMTGKNVGDLLNQKQVSWGWFQGGFRPSTAWDGSSSAYAKCDTTHTNVGGAAVKDYSPHHNPFAYYKSTANPHHVAPKSVAEIGHSGRANHNYDLTDFDSALKSGNMPAVSFLKAGEYQDGHAGYSDPTDEQHFLVKYINEIEKSKYWKDTAIVVAYDDSDGWYDHVVSPVTNGSKDSATDSGSGKTTDSAMCQSGRPAAGGYADRCGPGTRQPLLVISPFSRTNHVDHTATEQASITRFIEDNWRTGRIGDASFDQRANSLDSMLDFRRPSDEQVILKDDGSVASVHHGRGSWQTVASKPTPLANVQDAAAVAPGGAFPAAPVAGGVGGAVVLVGAGYALARRRRARA